MREYKIRKLRSALKIKSALALMVALMALNSLSGCGKGNEVLATYDGGDVKRKELRLLLKLSFGDEHIKKATVNVQTDILKKFTLTKIIATEARKAGLDKDEEYVSRSLLLDSQSMLFAYEVYLRENFDGYKFKMMNLQALVLREANSAKPQAHAHNKQPEIKPATSERLAEAKELLKKLNDPALSDADVEKMILEKSELPRYAITGGYMDPLCYSCSSNRQKELTDALEKAENGKFMLVENYAGAQWLVRKIDDKTIGAKDLEGFFKTSFERFFSKGKKNLATVKDPKQKEQMTKSFMVPPEKIAQISKQYATQFVNMEKRGLLFSSLREAEKKHNFKFNQALMNKIREGKSSEIPANEELFSIDGKAFTLADLNKKAPLGKFPDPLRMNYLSMHSKYLLLQSNSTFKSLENSDTHKFIKDSLSESILGRVYLNKNVPQEPKVSEKEIKQTYDLRKHTQYKGKSYSQVKAGIKKQLESGFARRESDKIQNQLTGKYKMKINAELLKANEP